MLVLFRDEPMGGYLGLDRCEVMEAGPCDAISGLIGQERET